LMPELQSAQDHRLTRRKIPVEGPHADTDAGAQDGNARFRETPAPKHLFQACGNIVLGVTHVQIVSLYFF
jgi:hypothetical protein